MVRFKRNDFILHGLYKLFDWQTTWKGVKLNKGKQKKNILKYNIIDPKIVPFFRINAHQAINLGGQTDSHLCYHFG